MRFARLVLLGLLTYVISIVVLFPVAPLVDRVKPNLGPIELNGVSGRLYRGIIERVRYTDDLLPLEFHNVGWAVAPATLLKGSAGVSVSFDGYGGEGAGLITYSWNGDISITDLDFNAQAKALESLLPVPIASFSGVLLGEIKQVILVNQLLKAFEGKLTWNDAMLESPVPTALGTVELAFLPDGDTSHLGTLSAKGGDVTMEGTVMISLNGDFSTDVTLMPAASATNAVRDGLRQMGRADANGTVRIQRQGNVNRLL
jgi:hypothetical protein